MFAQRGGSRGGGGGAHMGGGGGGAHFSGGGSFGGGRPATGAGFRGSPVGGSFRGGFAGGFRTPSRTFFGSGFNSRFSSRFFYGPGVYFGFGGYWGYPYAYGYPYYNYYADPYYSDPYYDPYYYNYGGGYGYVSAPSRPAVTQNDYASPSPPPQSTPREPFYRNPDYYLIAFSDHTIRAAISYRVEGNEILWTSREHVEMRAPLSTVDVRFSEQINRDRRVEFKLP